MTLFEPTLEAAHARLAAVQPDTYARTRNALDGAVTRLSPYLTHGFLSLSEVYTAVQARHPLNAKHKFVFELGWRAYYRHVWAHLGDAIHQSLHAGLLPDDAYHAAIPADVLEARTGIPAIDVAVRELYETGYLHNHARMWLASYVVHLRKVHWRAGAQWMLGYLLDGDVASNHLSWQWVAGTGSSKPYLFNADNVAKFAPQPWHSNGTAIDMGYDAFNARAQSASALVLRADASRSGPGVLQPPLLAAAPSAVWSAPDGSVVAGKDVWLHHPWSLKAAQQTVNDQSVSIGVGLAQCHAHHPWSERRWHFVASALHAQTLHLWWGTTAQIAQSLKNARSVSWQADPHADAALEQLRRLLHELQPNTRVQQHAIPCLFEAVETYCPSFSQWWQRTKIVV